MRTVFFPRIKLGKLTGPQVYGYVDFSIKRIVATETKLTSTAPTLFLIKRKEVLSL